MKLNQNELNSTTKLSKMILLLWLLLFIASRFHHLTISPNIMMGYQGIRAPEAF